LIEAVRFRAQARHAEIDFEIATAERLPFPAEHFDIVAAVTVLCFVEDASIVFSEMARVLRPGGRPSRARLARLAAYPCCGLLAQLFEPIDARFSHATIGAAFLALAAVKPLPAR
jgi:ubiquinone/menaquinone biosynthesis C-methylase UbiE